MEKNTNEITRQNEQSTEETMPKVNLAHVDKFCYTKGQIKFLDPDKVKIKRPIKKS